MYLFVQFYIHVSIDRGLCLWYYFRGGVYMAAYKGFTDAQAKAHKKYMENVSTIQIRTTAERREFIKAHAESQGESVNAFINRAIDETIKQDKEKEWDEH